MGAYAGSVSKPKPEGTDEKARRRRAERLLGGLLPDRTQDESAESWGDRENSGARDDEIRRDVPPHHGP